MPPAVIGKLPLGHQLSSPIEGQPAAHLRGRVVVAIGKLPDPRVLVFPGGREQIDCLGQVRATCLGQVRAGEGIEAVTELRVQPSRVKEIAKRAELKLPGGRVPVSYGLRPAITGKRYL